MRLRYFILFLFVWMALSCSGDVCTAVSDNVKEEYELYDYYVDEYGNEGIVAMKGETSWCKYIAVISLDEGFEEWGPENDPVYVMGELVTVDIFDGLYWGLDMNQMIERLGAEKYPAFHWCHQKNKDGKPLHSSSWLLPTFVELLEIFYDYELDAYSSEKLNEAIVRHNGTPLKMEDYYWSATEDVEGYFLYGDRNEYDGYNQASRAISLSPEGQYLRYKTYWLKSFARPVRAIKYIYYESISQD